MVWSLITNEPTCSTSQGVCHVNTSSLRSRSKGALQARQQSSTLKSEGLFGCFSPSCPSYTKPRLQLLNSQVGSCITSDPATSKCLPWKFAHLHICKVWSCGRCFLLETEKLCFPFWLSSKRILTFEKASWREGIHPNSPLSAKSLHGSILHAHYMASHR